MKILITILIIVMSTGCASWGWESVDSHHHHHWEHERVDVVTHHYYHYDHHHHNKGRHSHKNRASRPLSTSRTTPPPTRPLSPPTRSISKGLPSREPTTKERE